MLILYMILPAAESIAAKLSYVHYVLMTHVGSTHSLSAACSGTFNFEVKYGNTSLLPWTWDGITMSTAGTHLDAMLHR